MKQIHEVPTYIVYFQEKNLKVPDWRDFDCRKGKKKNRYILVTLIVSFLGLTMGFRSYLSLIIEVCGRKINQSLTSADCIY